ASLPWLRRSALLSREDTKNLDFNQINEKMQQSLSNIIRAHAAELDNSIPSILAAHVGVASAMIGSERLMAIGQEHFLLISNIADPSFDYVALGHIHKHQVLSDNPPVVYSGSLERVDFGEEKDEKGFYIIDIEEEPDSEKRNVSYEFHRVEGRTFRTIDVDIDAEDEDPTETILKEIHRVEAEVDNAVVRLQINLPEESESQIRDSEIREALKSAYYSTVSKDVSRESRIRLGASTVEEVEPVEALKTYLEANYSPERAEILLEYGEKLIAGEQE
ncbi:MAG: exonuclease SbcCD subunit D, partial [Dehalococcoidales bacterium]